MAQDFLGFGLTRPFRRDKKTDFASASGIALVKSSIGQILGTVGSSEFTQGEMPWRPEFGSLLHRIRHQNNTVARRELAEVYTREALARWEPRVVVTNVEVSDETEAFENKLSLRIRFNVIERNVAGNNVLLEGLETSVPI